jgi:hypothetical protein
VRARGTFPTLWLTVAVLLLDLVVWLEAAWRLAG